MRRLFLFVYFLSICALCLPQWQGNNSHFIFGENTIQLNDTISGTSYLSKVSSSIENASWEFDVLIQRGTSSSNYALVYLVSTSPTLDSTGYYVMVGNTADEVSLYRQDIGKNVKIIDGADKRIDYTPTVVSVKVTRTGSGVWSLFSLTENDVDDVLEGQVLDATYYQSSYFGLMACYTSTRADETTFSNIMISGNPYTDHHAPFLDSAIVLTENKIRFHFDEPIMSLVIQNASSVIYDYQQSIVDVKFQDGFPANDSTSIQLLVEDSTGNILDTSLFINYIPFEVIWCEVKNSNTIYIQFNKDVMDFPINSIVLDGEYPISLIKYGDGYLASFGREIENKSTLHINIIDVFDINGDELTPFAQTIDYAIFEFNDLIFSEIMPDPNPSVGVWPESEYIELFNNTNYSTNLESFTLLVDDNIYPLPNYLIKAYEYIIVGSEKYISTFPDTINKLVVDKFPTLNNTEECIKLYRDSTILIDIIDYNVSWHLDNFRKDGGFSLERIDQNNPSQINNWTSSCALSGATPGEGNCNNGEYYDEKSPSILQIDLLNDSTISVWFSELIWEYDIENIQHYSMSNNVTIEHVVSMENDLTSQSTLYLSEALYHGEIYELTITGVPDLCENTCSDTSFNVAICQLPKENQVVINEIMFAPRSNEQEYIELYNVTDKPFDLRCLMLVKADSEGGWSSGKAFSENYRLLMPYSYIVATSEPQSLMQQYVINPENITQVSSMPSFSNEADELGIVLLNSSSIDEVNYSEEWHSTLLNSTKGVSLERVDAFGASSDPNTWFSASGLYNYGTPGTQNSQQKSTMKAEGNIEMTPSVFTPDGDGSDDFSTLIITNEYAESTLRAMVFNHRGQCVKELANNVLIGASSQIIWDGSMNNGDRSPLGAYIVWVEIITPEGVIINDKIELVISVKNE